MRGVFSLEGKYTIAALELMMHRLFSQPQNCADNFCQYCVFSCANIINISIKTDRPNFLTSRA